MLFGPGADSGTFDYFTEAIVGKAKTKSEKAKIPNKPLNLLIVFSPNFIFSWTTYDAAFRIRLVALPSVSLKSKGCAKELTQNEKNY